MISYLNEEAPKFFGIGLSRTGTTSLHAAFLQLGLRSHHWLINAEGRLAGLQDAYAADAITDLNAAYSFETLAHIFPKAKFVYTHRPIESWERAVQAHYGLSDPQELKSILRQIPVSSIYNADELNTVSFHAMHHSLYTQHPTWRAAYRSHEERVLKFFEGEPERLLIFDLFEARHGWAHLCAFMDVSVPDGAFPNVRWTGGSKLKALVGRH